MNNFLITGADTDSICFCKPDMSQFSEEEQEKLLKELNILYPQKIKWEHDGLYQVMVVVKAKNYIKLHDGKLEIKGSGLKDPKKEPAIREFMDKVINCLVYDKKDEILNLYKEYIKEVHNVKDITRWTKKITITESVLNPKRTNEQKVMDALNGEKVQMGDKRYFYFDKEDNLKLQENWNNDHNLERLMGKVYKSLNTFSNVLDMSKFTKFTLKSHQVRCDLADLLGLEHPDKQKRTRKIKELIV